MPWKKVRQGQEASSAAEGRDREQGLFIKGGVGGTIAKDIGAETTGSEGASCVPI